MSTFSQKIEEKVVPVIGNMAQSRIITSLTGGMMSIMPLTLGTFLIAIAANFPVAAWTNWLTSTGLKVHMTAVISATTEMLGMYVAFSIAYHYAKKSGIDGMTSGILSLATFIILMPQKITLADEKVVDALAKTYLGSSGIFVAMLIAIIVASSYVALTKKGLVIKLPDSVPQMVSQSLSPTFIAIILFVVVCFVRVVFGMTEYGNIFDFINTILTKPIVHFGSSPLSLIVLFIVTNLFWFFGIHPSTVFSVYIPVIMTVATENVGAFLAGNTLPHLPFSAIFSFMMIGGTGCTMGLAINMLLFAKSERFKALGKLSIVPSLFNINEPLIFGTPIIFNPLFFPPLLLSSVVTGMVGILFVKLGAFNTLNPTVALPWTMPAPITALLQTGIMAAIAICCAITATAVLYYPFFKYADKQAVLDEKKDEMENNKPAYENA